MHDRASDEPEHEVIYDPMLVTAAAQAKLASELDRLGRLREKLLKAKVLNAVNSLENTVIEIGISLTNATLLNDAITRTLYKHRMRK